jgi:hypothetical protein
MFTCNRILNLSRTIITTLLPIIILTLTVTSKAEITKGQAIDIALNKILAEEIGNVDVYVTINLVSDEDGVPIYDTTLTCPYSLNWVFFVDDFVFANWAHPCRYIFMNYENAEYQIVSEKWFPFDMDDFEKISGIEYRGENLLQTNPYAALEMTEENANLYAVIINGGFDPFYNHIRYWNDMSAIFCTLTQVYGYMPENIYVHSTDGTTENNHGSLDLDNDDIDDIEYPALKSSIQNTFQTLANVIGPEDQLFIYVTDHGDTTSSGESYICLWGTDKITSSQLKQMLSPINATEIIVVMEQCFSGGFITDPVNITDSHRVVHTAANGEEYSKAEVWITAADYDEFVFYWTAAARGYYPGNNPWDLGQAVGTFPFHNYFPSHPSDYDPDLNSDGLVQMQEAFSYANNWNSWSPDGFYDPYYSGDAEHPLTFHNNGFQEDILTLTGISGIVVNSQTVSGNFLLAGDLTISTNIVLDINPGSQFALAGGNKIHSYGTLIAEGEAGNQIVFNSQSSSSYIIRLYNSTSSASSLEYCKFQNAVRGLYVDNSSPEINSCEITNCTYGIYNNYAYPTVYGTDISSCSYGIYNYWSGGDIINNELNCSSYGIYNYRSSPDIYGNEMYGAAFGIRCNSYSSPQMATYSKPGYNEVHDNFMVGLYAEYHSNPFMGYDYCGVAGNNSFVDNETGQVSAVSSSSVLAELNWWGSTSPPSGWFGGDVDYIPYLTSPPAMKIQTSPEEVAFDIAFKDEPGLSNSLEGPSVISFYDKDWNLRKKTRFAHALIYNGEPEGALNICKEIINQHPDSSLTFFALDLMWQASRVINKMKGEGLGDFMKYLDFLSSKTTNKLLYGSAELLLAGFEREKGLARIDTVFDKYRHTYLAENALFQKFMFYFNDKEDSSLARSVVDDMDRLFPKSPLTLQAHHLLGDPVSWSKPFLSEATNPLKTEELYEVVPEKYELIGVYPNPFNPSTRIKYALPQLSGVEVDIYNMIGQRIKGYQIASQQSGIHDLVWDGTNDADIRVSSGLYIIHLKAISLEDKAEVFEKSAKVTLLK